MKLYQQKNDQEGVTPQDPRCIKNVTKMNFSHSCVSSEGKVFRVLVPIHNTFMVVMVVVVVVEVVVVLGTPHVRARLPRDPPKCPKIVKMTISGFLHY